TGSGWSVKLPFLLFKATELRRRALPEPSPAPAPRRGVVDDAVDHRELRNEGHDAHCVSAPGTSQRVDLEDPAQQLRPNGGGLGRARAGPRPPGPRPPGPARQ